MEGGNGEQGRSRTDDKETFNYDRIVFQRCGICFEVLSKDPIRVLFRIQKIAKLISCFAIFSRRFWSNEAKKSVFLRYRKGVRDGVDFRKHYTKFFIFAICLYIFFKNFTIIENQIYVEVTNKI